MVVNLSYTALYKQIIAVCLFVYCPLLGYADLEYKFEILYETCVQRFYWGSDYECEVVNNKLWGRLN